MKKFIIIDGNAILHRAWHALPPTLTTDDGTIVNAVYGFTSILLRVIKDLRPDYVAVAWDTAAKTFRDDLYADYKGTRVTKEQELYDQIPMIQEVTDAFHIPNLFLDGYEADDVIGTLAKKAGKKADMQTIIVTGDLDSLQLVDDQTQVYALRKGITDTIIYDAAMVMERYGLRPDQIIDFKALKGDPSDNIKGVKGIGEKSATTILQHYDTLEHLYKTIDKLEEPPKELKPAQFKKLKEGKKDALLSKELVTIYKSVPVEFNFKDAEFGSFDVNKLLEIFQSYGFKSLMSRIPTASTKKGAEVVVIDEQSFTMTKGYHRITTKKDCEAVVAKFEKVKRFAFDTETTGLLIRRDTLLGVSLSAKAGESYFILVEAITDSLKKLFANEKIEKIGHQAKFDIEMLSTIGIQVENLVFDTKLAAYLLHAGSRNHGLKELALTELGVKMVTLDGLLKEGKKSMTMTELAATKPMQLADYACADADMTLRLYDLLKKQLKEQSLSDVLTNIELPLIHVLSDMELAGIKVDTKYLQTLSVDMQKRLKRLEKKIYDSAGMEFNINSPSQLADILFDKLHLPTQGIKKTKSGYSTAAPELEKLRPLHPIIDLMSEYRELYKLTSTYIDSLPTLVNPNTKRIHTNFNQTVAATGRLSSIDPNLQNIPIRTEEGRKIRQAFVAPTGYVLMSADYSQFELRIVASLAGDKKMIKAFKEGEDIHKRTAASIFGIDISEVTDAQRYAAKAVNFGIIYGQGPFGLSQTAKMSMAEAKEYIEKYFIEHKAIADFLNKTKENARKLGYVETAFGRRRYLPEINSGVAVVRAGAERMAINMPVQGTQADLLKLAMIELSKQLKQQYTQEQVRMLLTVHDEIVFEVKKELVEEIASLARKVMEHPKDLTLEVPIKVDVEVGKNWGEMESLSLQKNLI